jgi:hypothetical protein
MFICLCLCDIRICLFACVSVILGYVFTETILVLRFVLRWMFFFCFVKNTTGGVSRVSYKGERRTQWEETSAGRSNINNLLSRVFNCKLCDVTFLLKYQCYISVWSDAVLVGRWAPKCTASRSRRTLFYLKNVKHTNLDDKIWMTGNEITCALLVVKYSVNLNFFTGELQTVESFYMKIRIWEVWKMDYEFAFLIVNNGNQIEFVRFCCWEPKIYKRRNCISLR